MRSGNELAPAVHPFTFWAAAGAVVLLAACENPQPPGMCGSIPDQTVVVGERTTVSACFEDPNGDLLSYDAASSDAGVATVSVSGSTLTVTAVSPGTSVVTVTATDVTDLTGNQRFRVLVPNRAPVPVGEIAAREIPAGESGAVDVSAHFMDPDGQPLTYAMAASDESVVGISATGAVVTLEALAKGTATVTATATDPGGLSAVQSFRVTVPNRTPGAVGTMAPQTIEVDAAVTTDVTGYFTDPDGDYLVYTAASSDPSVTEVAVSGGELTVTAIAKGEATVTVTATDTEGLSATQEFAVTVPNRAPVAVGSIEERTIAVDEVATLDLAGYFEDPDGDVLVYGAAVSDGAVAGVAVAGGTLAVTATAKGTATVTVTATDTDGLAATQVFGVTVPNRAPLVTGSIEGRTIEAGEAESLDLSSYFSDPDGDDLVFAAAASDAAVAGAAVEGKAMTLTAMAKGEATVTVTATDTEGLTATQAFLVTVPNRPPLAAGSIEARTLEVGESAVVALPGYFEDPDGDALTFAVASSDATLVDASVEGGELTVTAVAKGDASVTVTATDTEGLTATHTFAVTVANQPPLAMGSIEAQTIEVNETATLDLSSHFTDPDGDDLAYDAVISDVAVAGIEVSSRTLTVTAIAKGAAMVTVTATDIEGLTATQEFAVTVPNRAPLAAGFIDGRTVEVGEAATIELRSHFSDPDGDELVYTAAVSDAALVGALVSVGTVMVTAVAKGEATVTVTATDTEGLAATQAFVVTVPNRAPTAVGSIEPPTLGKGEQATVELPDYFEDPDGDELAYSVSSSDATRIDAALEGTTVTLEALAKGSAVVTVTATDPDGLTAIQEVAATVANRPPRAVGSIATHTVNVDEAVRIELPAHFSDPDGDPLSYMSYTSKESVVGVSVSGGTMTLTALAKGLAGIIVVATDPDDMTATQEFFVAVPNRAPQAVGTVAQQRLSEGGVTRFDPWSLFTDPDGDELVFQSESSNPAVAKTWVATNGVLVRGVRKGAVTVTISAEDPDGVVTEQRFGVRVKASNGSDSNDPPVAVGQIHNQNLEEGDTRMVDASSYFDDPDDDPLEFSARSSDLEVVEANVSGSEVELEVTGTGTATVTVKAEDAGGLQTTQTFGVAVNEASDANRAPALVGTIATQTLEATGDTTLDVSSYFTDPDNDPLVFRAWSSDVEVVSVTVSGSNIAVQATGPGTATVFITAEDTDGLTAQTDFGVTVLEPEVPNRPPVAYHMQPLKLKAGNSKTVDAAGWFQDPDEDDLTLSAESSDTTVAKATISGDELEVEALAEGKTTITVTAEDPEGLSASGDFEVTVGLPKTNKPPYVIRTPDSRNFIVGGERTIAKAKHFGDPDDAIQDLRVSAESSDSTKMKVAEIYPSGNVDIIAKADGEATITVTATDPAGLSASFSVVYTIGNNPPTLYDGPERQPPSIKDGATLGFPGGPCTAGNPHCGIPLTTSPGEIDTLTMGTVFEDNDVGDEDNLRFSVRVSDNQVVRASIEASGLYGWYLRVRGRSPGEATIIATATDIGGLKLDYEIPVTVLGNRPPRLETQFPDLNAGMNDTVVIVLSGYFSDPDGDELVYTVRAGAWYEVSISADTATLVPTTVGGIAAVRAIATDPSGREVSDLFSICKSCDQQEQQASSADGAMGIPVFAAAPDLVRPGLLATTETRALNPKGTPWRDPRDWQLVVKYG